LDRDPVEGYDLAFNRRSRVSKMAWELKNSIVRHDEVAFDCRE